MPKFKTLELTSKRFGQLKTTVNVNSKTGKFQCLIMLPGEPLTHMRRGHEIETDTFEALEKKVQEYLHSLDSEVPIWPVLKVTLAVDDNSLWDVSLQLVRQRFWISPSGWTAGTRFWIPPTGSGADAIHPSVVDGIEEAGSVHEYVRRSLLRSYETWPKEVLAGNFPYTDGTTVYLLYKEETWAALDLLASKLSGLGDAISTLLSDEQQLVKIAGAWRPLGLPA